MWSLYRHKKRIWQRLKGQHGLRGQKTENGKQLAKSSVRWKGKQNKNESAVGIAMAGEEEDGSSRDWGWRGRTRQKRNEAQLLCIVLDGTQKMTGGTAPSYNETWCSCIKDKFLKKVLQIVYSKKKQGFKIYL